MVDAHRRVGGVDRLAARAARTHDLDLQILGIDGDVDVLELGHDGHRRGRRVHATLRFGGGHALHAMHARLVLQLGVGAFAFHRGHDFLEPARRSARHGQNLDLPAPSLGETRVHAEEIGGKQRCLLSAGAAADFEQDVLVVVGILGKEQKLHPLFEAELLIGELRLFLPRQIPHFGILLHLARFIDARHGLSVNAQGIHQLAQIGVLLGQLLHERRLGEHVRIRELARQLVEAALDNR